MGGQTNWPVPTEANGLLGQMQRRTLAQERRPQFRTASDFMGPGFAPKAVRLLDWNDDATAFNGLFFSEPGAQNSPDVTRYWMGLVEGNSDGYGTMRVLEYRNGADTSTTPDEWVRTFASVSGTLRTYGPWMRVRSGLVRNVVSVQGVATVGPSAALTLALTTTIPFPVNGAKYRAFCQGLCSNSLAGANTAWDLRQGVGITTGGTIFGHTLVDQRVATLGVGLTIVAEFVYAGATGAASMNITATFLAGSGTAAALASATAPMLLTVDEIMP